MLSISGISTSPKSNLTPLDGSHRPTGDISLFQRYLRVDSNVTFRAANCWRISCLTVSLSSLAFIACHDDQPYVYSCQDGPVNFGLFNDDLNPGAYLNHVGTTKLDYNIIQDESDMYEKLYIIYLRKKVDFKSKSLIVISMNGGGKTYVVNGA